MFFLLSPLQISFGAYHNWADRSRWTCKVVVSGYGELLDVENTAKVLLLPKQPNSLTYSMDSWHFKTVLCYKEFIRLDRFIRP